jgi:hypothetical protein
MKGEKIVDMAASVRQRLLNLSRERGVAFDQLLQYYAVERFLYRLSLSQWAESLVVKGATLLRIWDVPFSRPTRDIDFLGSIPSTPEAVLAVVRECFAMDVASDGLIFRPAIEAEEIRLDGQYPGVRIVVRGSLSGAVFRLQLDIGVGDVAVPDPAWVDYPSLLDMPMPRVLAYDPATAVAEKVEAMVALGEVNSRLKDFYDVWLLATSLEFDGAVLGTAFEATFARRGTALPDRVPIGLTDEFAEDPLVKENWMRFRRKAGVDAELTFTSVIDVVRQFVVPPLNALAAGGSFTSSWRPGGPWSDPQ